MVLGRYELMEKIGLGGFSTVYQAYDHKMAREVAVKAIPRTDELDSRARREAQAVAKLNHANIVTVFEIDSDDDEIYIVSELVRGLSLSHHRAAGSLSDRELVTLMAQVFDALAHAHRKGVVHRDIKPENIMIDEPRGRLRRAKVMDFGIAQLEDTGHLTRGGDIVGTVSYMSPEQAGGELVDSATDVYSAGVTLYACLAGKHPFSSGTVAETVARIHAGSRPLSEKRPDLPPEISDLLEEAMDPEPELRPLPEPIAAGLERAARQLPGADDEATTVIRGGARRLAGGFADGFAGAYAAAARRCGRLVARLATGLLAALVTAAAVYGSDLYPRPWALPLVAATALLAVVFPRMGLFALTAVALSPVFVFSPGAGIIAGIAALAYLSAAISISPRGALLPVAAPALALLALAPAFPGICGMVGRARRGPIAAFGGAMMFIAVELVAVLPRAGDLPPDAAAAMASSLEAFSQPLAGIINPLAALEIVTRPLREQPFLLAQAPLWALAALPAALLIRRVSWLQDVAGMLLADGVLAAGYLMLPGMSAQSWLDAGSFMKMLLLCAIIQCGLLLISPRNRPQFPSLRERT
jgi:tRNA A-37 threonylcarbamoyl transferase component Bud32